MTDLSILIVNTQSRDLLLLGLDAVQRELADSGWRVVPAGGEPMGPNLGRARFTGLETVPIASTTGRTAEVLVLDNASTDGSADAALAHPLKPEVVALDRRVGKATADSTLLRRAVGDYGLLLNEDAELQPGSLTALVKALDEDPGAAAVGARLIRPDGTQQPSAWAFPSVRGAVQAAIGQPDRVVQSLGTGVRRVDWAQSAALLVRVHAAREIGYFDEDFFVYSDEVDFARRLTNAGHHVLWTSEATVIHHEQLSTDLARAERRIVEFHRGRDRYLRKHHSAPERWAITALTVLTYAARAVAAVVLPGHDPRRYLLHVRAAAQPGRGEGLREAAVAFNRERE
ncbi:MAG: glycosyltransferase [Solirubrobacteraceae bacterium]|nr:glycosyltransferase [Solirubrobacteraceae bacterium]